MNILGIETSCDETAAAVVADGCDVRSSLVSSQVKLHSEYGGVVPELAAREHLRNIDPLVLSALNESGLSSGELDGVAVTHAPGLVPALLVGLNYAKGLSLAGGIPLIGVNHFTAHVYSCFLEHPDLLQRNNFPILALVVSGGHTSLALITADGTCRIIGRTVDDAAGEAFDKGAKLLGLGYPGGVMIERNSQEGDPKKYRFPRGLCGGSGKAVPEKDRFNFSFSGVKTALLYELKKHSQPLSPEIVTNLCASYQAAITDALTVKTAAAAHHHQAASILLCGGVACNHQLRQKIGRESEKLGLNFIVASARYCTDNAAMIAGLGWHELKQARVADMQLDASPRLPEKLDPASFAPDF